MKKSRKSFFPNKKAPWKIFCRLFLVIGILMPLSFPSDGHAQIQDVVDSKEEVDVNFFEGDLVVLKVYSLTRIAISDPGIVDIHSADVDELLIVARSVGETAIIIWDEYGKRKLTARVFKEDLDLIMARINRLLVSADIQNVSLEKNNYERKVVLTGQVVKEKQKDLEQILGKFQGHILNLVKTKGHLVQIDVQISELSTSLTKALGFDWAAEAEDSLRLPYQETLPSFDGSIGDFFKIGDFRRTTFIQATVNALIQEGKGRILSKPSIVVTDGEQASFLVGGEIPIRTTTTGNVAGAVQENVTFKAFGVDVVVTPSIRLGKIDLTLNITVSDVDAANAVGDNVAFSTRTATTKLLLDDKQTIVLAGLIKHNQSERIKRVPFLSSIPILGALFRVKLNPAADTEQEVVISITPRILKERGGEKKEDTPSNRYEAELAWKDTVEEAPVWNEEEDFPLEEEHGERFFHLEEDEPAKMATKEKEDSKKQIVPLEMVFKPAEALAGEDVVVKDEGLSSQQDITQDDRSTQAVTRYLQAIQAKISDGISFPYEAKEQGWEGTVTLMLTILSDGTLNNVSIKESSGHSIFDKDAVNTTQILAPFDGFPADIDLEELEVTIPITYSQEAILEGNSL